MTRIRTALLAFSLLAGHSTFAMAQDADKALGERLTALGYQYEVDEDGDYRLLFGMGDDSDEQDAKASKDAKKGEDESKERSQITFVRSETEQYGKLKVREIWSPAYRSDSEDSLPGPVANRLLEDSQNSILGAWVRQGNVAVFVVKIPADLDGDALSDAIEAATRTADDMEAELTPDKDEF